VNRNEVFVHGWVDRRQWTLLRSNSLPPRVWSSYNGSGSTDIIIEQHDKLWRHHRSEDLGFGWKESEYKTRPRISSRDVTRSSFIDRTKREPSKKVKFKFAREMKEVNWVQMNKTQSDKIIAWKDVDVVKQDKSGSKIEPKGRILLIVAWKSRFVY